MAMTTNSSPSDPVIAAQCGRGAARHDSRGKRLVLVSGASAEQQRGGSEGDDDDADELDEGEPEVVAERGFCEQCSDAVGGLAEGLVRGDDA